MKKIILAVFALVVLPLTGSASALTVDLIADGDNTAYEAGEVEVTYDGANLIVTITIDQGIDSAVLAKTHVHVFVDDVDFSDIKIKRGGPPPGKFDYSNKDPEATTVEDGVHEYTIPLTATGNEKVAVHAAIDYVEVVGEPDDVNDSEPDISYDEGGWAAGEDLPGRNWAMYIDLPWQVSAWDVTGYWELLVNGEYLHLLLTDQDGGGNLTGVGASITAPSYTWTMTGTVSGSNIDMRLFRDPPSTYQASFAGTIAQDGTMSGTGGAAPDGGVVSWVTTVGQATPTTAWALP